MFSQKVYADRFDKLFKERAERSQVINNVTEVCEAPWMAVACQMHRNLKTNDWNGDEIREVRRNWLRGFRPHQCDDCPMMFAHNLDVVKDNTDPDGYTRIKDGI
jgi:hypothetical protein